MTSLDNFNLPFVPPTVLFLLLLLLEGLVQKKTYNIFLFIVQRNRILVRKTLTVA